MLKQCTITNHQVEMPEDDDRNARTRAEVQGQWRSWQERPPIRCGAGLLTPPQNLELPESHHDRLRKITTRNNSLVVSSAVKLARGAVSFYFS